MVKVRWTLPLAVIGLILLGRYLSVQGEPSSPPCAPSVELFDGAGEEARLVCRSELPLDCRQAKTGDRVVVSDVACDVLVGQMSAAHRLVIGLPLDLNRVTVKDLLLLKGIGPVMAESIVEFRKVHGDFPTVERLLMVEGIGKGRLQALRPHLMVSNSLENPLKVLDSSTDGD